MCETDEVKLKKCETDMRMDSTERWIQFKKPENRIIFKHIMLIEFTEEQFDLLESAKQTQNVQNLGTGLNRMLYLTELMFEFFYSL